ncbi:MAG: hypothetical protein ACM3X6_09540 [Patescibacteria group bacterium]
MLLPRKLPAFAARAADLAAGSCARLARGTRAAARRLLKSAGRWLRRVRYMPL